MHESVPFSNATTSLAAAESVKADLSRMERVVHEVIVLKHERGEVGFTAEEVCLVTGLRMQTTTARIRALVLKGRVIDSGRTRKASSGRQAIVWRPTFGPERERVKQTHGRVAAAVVRERAAFRECVERLEKALVATGAAWLWLAPTKYDVERETPQARELREAWESLKARATKEVGV